MVKGGSRPVPFGKAMARAVARVENLESVSRIWPVVGRPGAGLKPLESPVKEVGLVMLFLPVELVFVMVAFPAEVVFVLVSLPMEMVFDTVGFPL